MTVLSMRVARSFTRGLPSYDSNAIVQQIIARSLVKRLIKQSKQRDFPRCLEAGYGTGHLTRALTPLKIEQLWLNDLVAAPLKSPTGAIYIQGNIETIDLPERLDLIISASMIQWIEKPQQLIFRLCASIRTQGWLAISGFAPHHFCELQALGSPAAAPSMMTPAEMAAYLPQGWNICETGTRNCILWFDTPMDILRHLRATGVNACAAQVWTRSDLAAFCENYTAKFGRHSKVPLTYAPVWLLAQKH